MNRILTLTGAVSGVAGVAICVASGLARIAGHYHVLGFQSTTLFNVGVGLMVFTCLVRLEQMARHERG